MCNKRHRDRAGRSMLATWSVTVTYDLIFLNCKGGTIRRSSLSFTQQTRRRFEWMERNNIGVQKGWEFVNRSSGKDETNLENVQPYGYTTHSYNNDVQVFSVDHVFFPSKVWMVILYYKRRHTVPPRWTNVALHSLCIGNAVFCDCSCFVKALTF